MNTTHSAEAILYTRAGVMGQASATQRPEDSSREGDTPPQITTTRRAAREPLPLPPDPYPGLRPFTHNESRLFCGRVMERLRLLNLLSESDFVAVLGSSGSGKSSLVLSGLIPDIRSGKLPGIPAAGMEFATFRPGRNPYANLAAVLFKTWLGQDLPDPFFIEEKLRSSPLALAQMCSEAKPPAGAGETSAANRLLHEGGFLSSADGTLVLASSGLDEISPPRSLLIVVDQFEEIFRFANLVAKEQDEESAIRRDFRPVAGELDEAQSFITLLLTAARQTSARVRVVITMRSDFFKHCEVFEGLPAAIAAHQFITPRMSREQMEDAIQMPLEHFESSISEDLVNTMLNEVHGEDDQLPVLQHALARMWHQAKAQRPPRPAELTAEDYQRAGRLRGAINVHGDRNIDQNGRASAQVGRFFRCLGDFDPTSGHAIRRPRTLAQISAESLLSEDEIRRIATAFAHPEASFITVTPPIPETGPLPEGDIIIDLTHECLLRKWQAYTGWMSSEKREGDALKNLSQRMCEFEYEITPTTRRDHLTLGQYQRFTEILSDIPHRPQAWGARYACDIAKTQRFLAAEKRYALIRRWRWPFVGAAFVLTIVVAAVSVYIANANAQVAQVQASVAESKAKEAEVKTALEKATREKAEVEFDAKMKQASAELVLAKVEKERAEADAKFAATLGQRSEISNVQGAAQLQAISALAGEAKSRLSDAEAAKAERDKLISTIYAAVESNHVKLESPILQKLTDLGFRATQELPNAPPPSAATSISSSRKIKGFSKSLLSVALLPDPREKDPYQYRFLTGGKGGLWSHELNEHSYVPPRATTAPVDKKTSAPLRVWDQDAAILSVSTQPDSSGWIIATNAGPDLGLSKDSGKTWRTLTTNSPGLARARMLSRLRLVYGTTNGKIRLIDLGQEEVKDGAVFDSAHTGTINDVVASPDGTLLLASGDDNLATLWRIHADRPIERTLEQIDLGKYGQAGAPVRSASFSPDGRWLLLPSGEKSIQMCLLRTGDSPCVLKALTLTHDNPVISGAFSPDGRWIATADTSGKVYIWRSVPVPLTEGDSQPVGIFTGHTERISALAWAPNSAGLATADAAGAVIVWRLQIGATVAGVPLIMPTATSLVDALAWSPDSSLLTTADMAGVAQVHPLTFYLRTKDVTEDLVSADVLSVPAQYWSADFAGGVFLSTPQTRLRNPATDVSTLARVIKKVEDKDSTTFGISRSTAALLGFIPSPGTKTEIEIALSKLTNQDQPADDQEVRIQTARYLIKDEADRDGKGHIKLTRESKDDSDYAGVSSVFAPVLIDWIKTFVTEGMHTEAEAAAFDYYATTADIVYRWVDAPTKSKPADKASYNALQAYLRWMVSYYGAMPTARGIQTEIGSSADGIIGPATKDQLMKSYHTDAVGLLDKLSQVSIRPEPGGPAQFIAQKKQQALAFAKSFLSPTAASASAADRLLIDRARSAIGKGTSYKLGTGGMDPGAPHPASADGQCDCSGFVAWVLRTSRKTDNPFYLTQNGGWFETTAVQKDIRSSDGFFSECEAEPGCIVVYGDSDSLQGNIAIVTAVETKDGKPFPTRVIVCTMGNWKKVGDSIQEIAADDFVKNPSTVYGRLDTTAGE